MTTFDKAFERVIGHSLNLEQKHTMKTRIHHAMV